MQANITSIHMNSTLDVSPSNREVFATVSLSCDACLDGGSWEGSWPDIPTVGGTFTVYGFDAGSVVCSSVEFCDGGACSEATEAVCAAAGDADSQECTDGGGGCDNGIGDVTGDPGLAHKATHEGRIAAESIAGHKVAFEPQAIPAVVFTDPEIAWCGLTESMAKAQNKKVETVPQPSSPPGLSPTPMLRPDCSPSVSYTHLTLPTSDLE